MGMAGAFVGQADNPSAVWYNPAGITQLDGTRVSAGAIGVYPVIRHENTDGTIDVADREFFLPVQFFVTNRMNDRVSLGLGLTSPFGLSTDWSPLSATSGVATLSRIKTIDVNPNVAYRMSDRLSIAVGIDYMYLQATMDRVVPPGLIFRLDGDGEGLGANAAIKFRAAEQLNVGLSYRSRIKVKIDGTAGIPVLSASGQTEITLPDLVQVGVSYNASEKLTLNTDLEYTWWSTHDRLVITSPVPAFNATEEKNWKNTWDLGIGGQYRVSDLWKLRAGLLYDKNPVPSERFDTSLPDSDRQGVTIGTGYTNGNITVDTSYMYLHFSTRHIVNSFAGGETPVPALNGTYKTQVHLLAITFAYKF
jgi:long-chain fatty acid transport protein